LLQVIFQRIYILTYFTPITRKSSQNREEIYIRSANAYPLDSLTREFYDMKHFDP
jgi:hypothetical protein